MLQGAYIFRSPQEISGIFDTLFGGVFFAKGIPLVMQVLMLSLLPLTLLLVAAETTTGNRRFRTAALISSVCLFTAIVFFRLHPGAELFINLRHSLNFAENNTFSFNVHQHLEGTVDFLPYFILGLLGKLGLPIVEMSFYPKLSGWNQLPLRHSVSPRRVGIRARGQLGNATLRPLSPLCFNAAQGFTTTTFCAAVLWSIAILFFSPRWALGFALLSAVPVIRLEGSLLVAFLVALYLNQKRRERFFGRKLVAGGLVFLPILTLSLWRTWYFGSPIPLPIQFKSSLGSLFFFLVGIRNLLADLVASYTLVMVFGIALCFILLNRPVRSTFKSLSPPLRTAILILGLLALYSLPYYVSGGDWFPSYWGRYLFPLSIFSMLLGGVLLG